MRYNKNLIIGSSSMGKSYNMIVWELLRWVHDPEYTNIKNVSTTAGHTKAQTWTHLLDLHARAAIPLPGVATADFLGLDPLNKRAGISVVALPTGDKGKGRLQGFHPVPRDKPHPIFGPLSAVILIIDEGEDVPVGLWEGVDNMLANEDEHGSVKIASSTNPKNKESMFAQKAMPKGGWGTVHVERDHEWDSEQGWRVTRLDAAQSRNVIERKLREPGLQTYQGFMNVIRRGTADPGYWTWGRGWYPEQGAVYKVIDDYIMNDVLGTYLWSPGHKPTPMASLDPAFSDGGDGAILTVGRYGQAIGFEPSGRDVVTFAKPKYVIQVEQQFPINKDNAVVMAKDIKELCKRLGVLADWFVMDASGNADGLFDILLVDFGNVLGTVWGSDATDRKILEEDTKTAKEQYLGLVTEMWFATSKWMEFGYIKVSPFIQTQKLFGQLNGRRYEFAGKTLRRVESKPIYKGRTGGASPDEADSFILLTHLIRMRQMFNAAMMPDRRKEQDVSRGFGDIRSAVDRIEFFSEDGL